jgi:hypothetical protein
MTTIPLRLSKPFRISVASRYKKYLAEVIENIGLQNKSILIENLPAFGMATSTPHRWDSAGKLAPELIRKSV